MADKPSIGAPSPIEVTQREKPEVRLERPESASQPVRVEKETRSPKKERVPTSVGSHPTPAPHAKKRSEKSETRKEIEDILAKDLEEVYLSLPAAMRARFRSEGEKTAIKVELLFHKAKLAILDIIKIIREWLLIVPGVNRFFVEQEAKIKADKLIHLHDEKQK